MFVWDLVGGVLCLVSLMLWLHDKTLLICDRFDGYFYILSRSMKFSQEKRDGCPSTYNIHTYNIRTEYTNITEKSEMKHTFVYYKLYTLYTSDSLAA